MDELIAADCDSHMTGAGRRRGEEEQITWFERGGGNGLADGVLIANAARDRKAMLTVDELHEAAAVEAARGLGTTIAIGRAAERQRRPGDCVPIVVDKDGRAS